MRQQSTIPSFVLYQISSDTVSTCFQSSNQTIICSLDGPYFDRKKISLDPIFNISINSSSKEKEGEISQICEKLQQILRTMIIEDRYLRMTFDIRLEIIEEKRKLPRMFSCFVNLLCFTFMVSGIQIKSMFSCADVCMKDSEITWMEVPQNETQKYQRMIMGVDSIKKEVIYLKFEGEYNFLDYQKLANVLLDANQEFQKYISEKISQINDKS